MKKIIALALALVLSLSMATVAFALPSEFTADSPADGAEYNATAKAVWILPGESFKLDIRDFQLTEDKNINSGFTSYFTDDYFTVSKVEYDKGRDLVESVKFDGDGKLAVKIKANYKLEAPKLSNLIIKDITLTAKKNTEAVDADGVKVTKGKKLTLYKDNKNIPVYVGYKVIDEKITGSDFTATPVPKTITKFVKDGADYGTATMDFASGDISVEVRVYKDEKFNFVLDQSANLDIIKANPDANPDFYNFKAAPSFSSNAVITLSADEDSFIYELKDGKLVKSNLKWDKDVYAFVGKTNTLGSYVVSDVELKNAVKAEDDTKNPNTGANDFVGVAVALAVVSLVAAGAVSLKK